MADYTLEYYHQYYDLGGILHRVELLQLEYSGGSTALQSSASDPVRLRNQGADKDTSEDVIIQGQELEFEFYCSRANISTFDSLFEADYKDYKVRYYIDSVLEFEGWLKPENLSREFTKSPPNISISLSATDGLTDLQKIEWRTSINRIITGKLTILEILKYAVAKTGIELDFSVQLNTYETTYMLSTECALKKVYADSRRFIEDDGTVHFCWDVIQEVLKPFNVVFKQYKGQYQITRYAELDSYVFVFNYTTLNQTSRTEMTGATSNIIDISAYQVAPNVIEQKVRPLYETQITFRNKDLGGDITAQDLTDWAGVWTINFSSSSVSSGVVNLVSDDGSDDDYIVLNSAFSVSQYTENDFIKLEFDYKLVSATSAEFPTIPPSVLLKIEIQRPDTTWSDPRYAPFYGNEWRHYESNLNEAYNILAAGDYNVKISFVNDPHKAFWNWDDAVFQVKSVTITKIVNVKEEIDASLVTRDQFFSQITNVGYDIYKTELLLADTEQTTEIGSLICYDGAYHNTLLWFPYNGDESSAASDGIKIVDLYARTILNDRWGYKNYLKGRVIDLDNTLGFNNIITIDSRNYRFLSFNKNCREGSIDFELIELLPNYYNLSYLF